MALHAAVGECTGIGGLIRVCSLDTTASEPDQEIVLASEQLPTVGSSLQVSDLPEQVFLNLLDTLLYPISRLHTNNQHGHLANYGVEDVSCLFLEVRRWMFHA